MAGEPLRLDFPGGSTGADQAERRFRRFLHHLADRTGEFEVALAARNRDDLHRQNDAAAAGPRHAGGTSRRGGSFDLVAQELAPAEQFVHQFRGDRGHGIGGEFAFDDAPGDLAAHLTNHPFQFAHSRLAGIVVDQFVDAGEMEAHLLPGEAVFTDLARHQITPGDLPLLERGIAGQADDLHAVAQRPRDRVEQIGRRDEKDLAQVVIDF